MDSDWKFDDPPNVATYTTTFVLDGSPILRVYHDYDGEWQFHGSLDQPATADVGQLVALETMVTRDNSLVELHDLPCGWRATRLAMDAPWRRDKNNPFPTYEEHGYYLEDALWMAEYRDDVNPPPEDIRENLEVGSHVKLLFRFADEDAPRKDCDTERMWVLISEIDEDENYVGVLDNDPHHGQTLKCGDMVHFHPLHVMETLADAD
ncbi:MAG: hypothetical protein Aurels2KO_45920 [Aureliella sp.]